MISIRNNCKDPHFNLALEEYAIKYLNPSQAYIILWQNEPSVIIGKNQNTSEEINSKYISDNNINVVRRLSGGGAVYHDLGNLNFTFIVTNENDVASNFRIFTEPVINALRKLGVEAEFTGRNDITIDGKKFSGNAQYYYGDRLLHHGTILFNSNLSVVQDALNVKQEKIESKGIKSVKSRVTNVYPYLKKDISIDEFKDTLLKFFMNDENYKDKEYILTEDDIKKIHELMKNRFSTWEWNYGESPAFDVEKGKRYTGGKLELKFNVADGLIKKLKINGDFFGRKGVGELEPALLGIKYRESDVKAALTNTDFEGYFAGISVDDFIDCMFY